MLLARLLFGALAAYVALTGLAWLFQERLTFPSPRAPLPDPAQIGLTDVELVSLVMKDGTRLAGWFFPPRTREDGERRGMTGNGSSPSPVLPRPTPSFPAILWFYGNGENIGTIWPVLRDFQPPHASLMIVDYPGYGASDGRASEARIYEAAELSYEALVARPDVDPERVFLYGRSLGSAVATHLASTRPVAGLVLDSPFTSAREMRRRLYPLLPAFILRLRLDNLDAIGRLRCPVLVFHGTADRLVPAEMGRRVAAAAPGPSELVLIDGAEHNDTYARGGSAYRGKVWAFVRSR